MLEIERVSKVYKSGTFGGGLKQALRQVTFSIDEGEVVALIGESGSGKSTLGKILLRLVPLSAGRVLFEGNDIAALKKSGLHEYYRHVQGVFQDPFSSYNPLYKADRVFEMLRQEYFSHLARPEWEDKVHTALEGVSLNPVDVLNKFPHQLSGGQLQRLLVARALLLDVKLLIADEIISMLDASTRVDVLNLLVGLKKRGLGILFITHDLSLGNYISDRTVILRQGVVLEMGPTPMVFGNPRHSYTKGLLTAVPQLHKKWEQGLVPSDAVASGANGSASHLSPAAQPHGQTNGHVHRDTPAGGAGAQSPQYPQKSDAQKPGNVTGGANALPPGGAPQGALPQGSGPRPSLMDMPDQPWQRRSQRMAPKHDTIAVQPPPELVECEEGHFVAVEHEA